MKSYAMGQGFVKKEENNDGLTVGQRAAIAELARDAADKADNEKVEVHVKEETPSD